MKGNKSHETIEDSMRKIGKVGGVEGERSVMNHQLFITWSQNLLIPCTALLVGRRIVRITQNFKERK